MFKRSFDLLVSSAALIALAPVLTAIAVAIKLDSPGPVFFRQQRVGRRGRLFRIHKFRTMIVDAERRGPQITVGADFRITRIGRFLRQYKFDELVQLIDVMRGDMSFVGPRPEVPRFVACYPDDVREIVLSVRPGITDWASIRFKDENDILGAAEDPERAYVETILPIKLEYCVAYVKNRSFRGDAGIIWATFKAVAGGAGRAKSTARAE